VLGDVDFVGGGIEPPHAPVVGLALVPRGLDQWFVPDELPSEAPHRFADVVSEQGVEDEYLVECVPILRFIGDLEGDPRGLSFVSGMDVEGVVDGLDRLESVEVLSDFLGHRLHHLGRHVLDHNSLWHCFLFWIGGRFFKIIFSFFGSIIFVFRFLL
jgi:hypothetical protein